MAVVLTNWNSTQFATDTIKAFIEAGKVSDDSYLYSDTNETTLRYGGLAAIAVSNTADTTTDYTDSTITEAGTDVSPDDPLKAGVWIPESTISTNGSANILSNYSQQLGASLRSGFEKRFINLVGKNATLQQNLTLSGVTGSTVADALAGVSKQFDIANVPEANRYVGLHPTYFSLLWNVAGTRSSDFVSVGDNTKPFNELNFLGMNVRSMTYGLTANSSSDTTMSSKYRVNFASLGSPAGAVVAVAWHKTSIAVNWYEPLKVAAAGIFQKDMVLVKGRCLVGSGVTRTGACAIIVGV